MGFEPSQARAPLCTREMRPYMAPMHADADLKRLHWRAHHRGTREADMLIGNFFDAHYAAWSDVERAQFAAMLDEQDADVLAWAHGTAPVPDRFCGTLVEALRRLDYVKVAK